MLARSLVQRGHVVRGTTRDPRRRAAIEAVGAQWALADPDRMATLVGGLEHVTVAVLLLGSARGEREALAALHGPRLEALLTRMVDSTIRGVVYETRGSVDPRLLRDGAAAVRAFGERSRCRIAFADSDPARHQDWLAGALAAVEEVLGQR